uniref:DUF4485 domain-containing protein n=1 Tax=Syphacia muris TaxID=451379 RepID=A0A0N5AV91_9BILA
MAIENRRHRKVLEMSLNELRAVASLVVPQNGTRTMNAEDLQELIIRCLLPSDISYAKIHRHLLWIKQVFCNTANSVAFNAISKDVSSLKIGTPQTSKRNQTNECVLNPSSLPPLSQAAAITSQPLRAASPAHAPVSPTSARNLHRQNEKENEPEDCCGQCCYELINCCGGIMNSL